MAVYDPSGATVTSTSGANMATIAFTARATGTFTVVVFDYSAGYASSGDYTLSFALTQ